MRKILKWVKAWLPSAVVMAAILWLTLAPHPLPRVRVELFDGFDKVVHALMMFALAAALLCDYWRFKGRKRIGKWPILWIFVGVAIFSAFDEWAQGAMCMGRSADIWDFAADLTGAAGAALTGKQLINFAE